MPAPHPGCESIRGFSFRPTAALTDPRRQPHLISLPCVKGGARTAGGGIVFPAPLAWWEQFRAQRGVPATGGDEECGHGPQTREPAFQAGDGRPHHLFFTKRDGAAWRYQRKIVGARKRAILPEAKIRPDTPRSLPGSALTQLIRGPGALSRFM